MRALLNGAGLASLITPAPRSRAARRCDARVLSGSRKETSNDFPVVNSPTYRRVSIGCSTRRRVQRELFSVRTGLLLHTLCAAAALAAAACSNNTSAAAPNGSGGRGGRGGRGG